MEQIIVTRKNGTTFKLQSKENNSTITKAIQTVELLGNDVVDISVQSAVGLTFSIGDKITIVGRDYTLNTPAKETKSGERNFSYELHFEGAQYDMIRASFSVNVDTTTNEVQDLNGESLTGDFKMFLDVIISNINRVFPGKWSLGTYPEITETKTETFGETDNCLSVLQSLCGEDKYNAEFSISIDGSGNRTLNVGTIGQVFPFTFEYGKGKGLYELAREKQSSSNIITRLNVFGSSKNIMTTKYRASRLCLPTKSKGTSYIEDATAINIYGVWENTKIFDEIYPHRTGTITAVDGILSFVDSSMDFDLNEKEADGVTTKYLIAGASAKVSIKSGRLAGYEFEITKYDHATKKFTIVQQTDENGYKFPSSTSSAFQLSVGDEYVLTDIYLPQSYVDAAEAELLTAGTAYLNKYKQPNVRYSLSADRFFLANAVGLEASSNVIWVGDYMPVKDADFNVDVTLRVKAFTRDLLDDLNYTSITIADLPVTVTTITRVISDIKGVNNIIRINNLNDPARARRNYLSAQEVLNMVFDPEGDFYTEKIKPLSIDTTMLSVGAKSMQFGMVGTVFQPNYLAAKNRVVYSGGSLTHYTILDASNNPRSWTLADGDITLATDAAYYIYAKCARVGTGGTMVFSTSKILTESDANYFHFLVGIINSVDANNVRAMALMYGFTTVNGRFIKTGRIQSADGNTYFDLDAGEFRGNFKFTSGESVEEKIDNIVIGGVNHFVSGGRSVFPSGGVTYTANHADCPYGFKAVGDADALNLVRIFNVVNGNGYWTISFDIKCPDALGYGVPVTVNICDLGSQTITTNADSTWKRVSITANVTNYGDGSVYNFVDFEDFWGTNYYIKNIKVEKGDKATDWTPAPEDVAADIATAETAAANAQAAANAANTAIGIITSDNILSSAEKPSQRKEWNIISAEKTGINAQATTFGITTENTTYNNAFQALATYLNAGSTWVSDIPSWLADANLATNTAIVGSTYRDNWQAYYDARTTLLNAIAAKARTLANTAQETADGIQVGGRNHYKASQLNIFTNGTVAYDTNYPGCEYGFFANGGGGGANFIRVLSVINGNGNWTVSFDVKHNDALGYGVPVRVNVCDLGDIQIWTNSDNTWKHVTITVNVTNYGDGSVYNFVDFEDFWGTNYMFRNIKVETGNRATDWTPAPEDVDAKITAIDYLKTALQGSTDISGGLLTTNVLLMKTIDGLITGGMSGLGNDNIGMWTGGTYQQALDSLAKIILRKDGSGQLAGGKINWSNIGALNIGNLNVEGGAIVGYADNKAKIKIHTGLIESLSNLLAGTITTDPSLYSVGGQHVHYNGTGTYEFYNVYFYSYGTLTVPPNTQVQFYHPNVSVDVTNGTVDSTIKQYIVRLNGAYVGAYTGASTVLVTGGQYEIIYSVAYSIGTDPGNTAYTNVTSSNSGYITYQVGAERSEIGKNGLFSYWSQLMYLYFSSADGLKYKGAMDIPGVLATGQVAGGGAQSKTWGAKSNSGNTTHTIGSGIYDVPHSVGNTNYTVMLQPNVDGNHAFVISRTSTSFRVHIRDSSKVLLDGSFDYTIYGAN